ncbi:MAG TPA: hypothetical protein ENH82_20290 [bacterium]|nr:hypothetical protein [bacterium]
MKSAKTSKTVNKIVKVNVIGIKVKNKPTSVTFVTQEGSQVPQKTVRTRSNAKNGTQFVSATE